MRNRTQLAQPGNCFILCAALAIALAGPAFAQQPDAPSPAPQVSATVSTPASDAKPADTPTDPPAASADNDATEALFPHFKDTRFWLSGQANFIFQAHPDFTSPYSGENSLSGNYEKATSRVMTLYTGVRLNNSTELLVDIEEAGGAALSTGLGLAGNTDLDIVRNPLLPKAPYLGRGMIHKVFALSKDKIENHAQLSFALRGTSSPPSRNPLRQVQPARLLRRQLGRLRYAIPIHQLGYR